MSNTSNISYDRFTKTELKERFTRSDKHNSHMGFARQSFDQFIIQFYPSYMKELGITLPVLVLAESSKDTEGDPVNLEKATPINREAVIDIDDEARESIQPQTDTDRTKDSRGGQTPFNKKEYQRQLMRDRRAKEKSNKSC